MKVIVTLAYYRRTWYTAFFFFTGVYYCRASSTDVRGFPRAVFFFLFLTSGKSLAMRARFQGDLGTFPVSDVMDKILHAVESASAFEA